MKTLVFEMLLVLMAFHISCDQKELYYQCEDLVFVGEYTSGLEGPAVDREGNLYFVNPIRSGSVGKVDTEEILVYLFNNCLREVRPMEYVLVKIKACIWQIIPGIMF